MPDLDARLARLPRDADATVFASVRVTPELRARVARAADAATGAESPRRLRRVRPRAGASRRLVRPLVLAAGVVATATLAAVELWPGGAATASAALTVKPAGARYLVSVDDPHALAGASGIVALAGDATRRIPVEVDAPSSLTYRWSPDGRRLAFGNRGDLFVYDDATGATVNVTRTPRRWELLPAWSPDGSALAFTSRPLVADEGPRPEAPDDLEWVMVGVFGGSPTVVRADGGGYRILDGATVTAAPSWSPDGATLAYADDGVVEADVPSTVGNRRDGAIRLADVASGRVRTITPALGRGAGFVGAPSWSPSARELAFFYSRSDRLPSREEVLSGSAPRVRQGWAVLDPDTGHVTAAHVYEAPFVPRGPAQWSDDGTLLALLLRSETAIAEPSELRVVRRGGGTVRRLAGLYAHVAWEPGTHRLAARDDLHASSVVLVDADGEPAVERLRFDGEVDGLAWRAGGAR